MFKVVLLLLSNTVNSSSLEKHRKSYTYLDQATFKESPKMTSSAELQLTPGQRCLLDLLQRKLLNNIKLYANLNSQRQRITEDKAEGNGEVNLDLELQRLKEKIRRISARQKRFTLEIVKGNGNNTIPKESFFQALGLVTHEALSKLNSKTNERRRRTTANPRFSHEAIQAKRALEPLQKRLEPRVTKDRREPNSRKPQKNQSQQNNNNIDTCTNINTTSNRTNNNNIGASGKGNSQQQALNNNNNNNNTRSSSRSGSGGGLNRNRSSSLLNDERREHRRLLAQLANVKEEINTKTSQIKDKRESKASLGKQYELIRKKGLDLISTINLMSDPSLTFPDGGQLSNTINQHSQIDQTTHSHPEPIDIWIDMKCDESLDGLD